MKPLATIKKPVMVRVTREKYLELLALAHGQGLRVGPFSTHVLETIASCPADHFHEAMAAFLSLSRRRS